jgi:hypothetical protein
MYHAGHADKPRLDVAGWVNSHAPEWNANQTYKTGDQESFDGKVYMAPGGSGLLKGFKPGTADAKWLYAGTIQGAYNYYASQSSNNSNYGTGSIPASSGLPGQQDVADDHDAHGPHGHQWAQGPKGDKGDKGDQGFQGLKGDKGDKGDQGLPGLKGDKGDRGLPGLKGDKGDRGLQGLKGDPGESAKTGLKDQIKSVLLSLVAGKIGGAVVDTKLHALKSVVEKLFAKGGYERSDIDRNFDEAADELLANDQPEGRQDRTDLASEKPSDYINQGKGDHLYDVKTGGWHFMPSAQLADHFRRTDGA